MKLRAIKIITMLAALIAPAAHGMQPQHPANIDARLLQEVGAIMAEERARAQITNYLGHLPTELRNPTLECLRETIVDRSDTRQYIITIRNATALTNLSVRIAGGSGGPATTTIQGWKLLKDPITTPKTTIAWPLRISIMNSNNQIVLRQQFTKEEALHFLANLSWAGADTSLRFTIDNDPADANRLKFFNENEAHDLVDSRLQAIY